MDFRTRMKDAFDKGLEVTKDFFSKAGETAKDLSEKGVLQLEIRQLEHQSKKEIARLGHKVYELLTENDAVSISATTPEISTVLEEIKRIESEINSRESDLSMK